MDLTRTMTDDELIAEGVIWHATLMVDGGSYHVRLGVFISDEQYTRLILASRKTANRYPGIDEQ